MLWLSLILLLPLTAQATWQQAAEDDGIVLEVQEIEGSPYENIRVTGQSSADAASFARVWWGDARDTSAHSAVTKREVLVDRADERIVYDIIEMPIGTDRDYVLHVKKRVFSDSGTIALYFITIDDPRKPVDPRYVRMRIKASVVFTPLPGGGSRFVYNIFTDIKGKFPTFFVKGAQRRSALSFAKEMRRRSIEAN